jgi:very-short-patch-repair endonuclease
VTSRWSSADVVRHDGIRTTTATRAIIDFAASVPPAAALEAAIDSAIRLRRTALPRLFARMNELSGKGMSGVALLRELMLDSGGESHLERRFLRLLRVSGLPRPLTQVVFRAGTRFVARVDFLFPRRNLVVEVSGRLGHSSDRDRQRDARRRNELQMEGFSILEFTTADIIDDAGHVVRTLEKALLTTSQPPRLVASS